MPHLADFQQAEEDLSARLRTEIRRFNKHIGKPHVLVEDLQNPQIAVGYWRVVSGVMVIERSRDGAYRATKAQFFDDEVIESIAKAKEQSHVLRLNFADNDEDPEDSDVLESPVPTLSASS